MKKNLPFFKKNRNLSFASEVFSSNFSVQLGLESGVSLVRLSSVSRLSLVCLSCLSCQGAMKRTYILQRAYGPATGPLAPNVGAKPP